MKYDQGDPQELKDKFWKALAASPYVMLQLDQDPDSAAPMTAQLDKDANSAIWFFTSRDNRFAAMGAATATFASKGHDVFARFAGNLVEETSRERLDEQWSNFVEAWFPGGKDDPNLLMLRMDLGDASIWGGDLGVLATVKMALGMNVTDDIKGGFAETTL
ncbi:pyridoxamine 5'-phosphate oxidase family protein [Novosphingobium olei]|uniref:Pyridoxamine 5'-phosphate oxidase family protein n=1 Tax=Novosphingobium olei TaxID=2728851 RepID=A0A7Y0BQ00_9SPHN|nr:pyridoxamine 5'-phosphate oxidase family protein [Novosphingobium olei]NML94210.1 pyridoxamine 5'-phosphate oxidase family protein [Novosphingobium olei]